MQDEQVGMSQILTAFIETKQREHRITEVSNESSPQLRGGFTRLTWLALDRVQRIFKKTDRGHE